MLDVQGNNIHLTRGDTMFLKVELTDESGNAYIPVETDKIYFRVKRNSSAKETLIQKEIPYNTMILQLNDSDTKDMKFGSYYYEIELVTEDNYHFTAIADAEFELTTELESHG